MELLDLLNESIPMPYVMSCDHTFNLQKRQTQYDSIKQKYEKVKEDAMLFFMNPQCQVSL